jgi:hypothetical protein
VREIDSIVIHHSASPLTTTADQIKLWHLERGFRTVGYHYIVESDGTPVLGRPVWQIGAHVLGHNERTVGVCGVGDNTTQSQSWTLAIRRGLVRQVLSLRAVFGPLPVVRHCELADTLCPGLTESQWKELLTKIEKESA